MHPPFRCISIGFKAYAPDIRFNHLGVRSWIANQVLFCTHIVYTLMDHLAPPVFDVSNVDMWKFKMSTYLKYLGLHVYLATTKKSYLGNDKHIEANAQV